MWITLWVQLLIVEIVVLSILKARNLKNAQKGCVLRYAALTPALNTELWIFSNFLAKHGKLSVTSLARSMPASCRKCTISRQRKRLHVRSVRSLLKTKPWQNFMLGSLGRENIRKLSRKQLFDRMSKILILVWWMVPVTYLDSSDKCYM